MNRLFSLPIAVGLILGLAFPFLALRLIWVPGILLFLLLFFNCMESVPSQLVRDLRSQWRKAGMALLLLFVFWPVVQTAAAALLLKDADYVFGIALCSLAPVALVVPLFVRRNGGDSAFGTLLVIASTLLSPFALGPMIKLMGLTQAYFDALSLSLYFAVITVAPVILSLVISRALPRLRTRLARLTPLTSSLLLGALMFILVGSAFNKVPSRQWYSGDAPVLFALLIWMDFGIYWITRTFMSETVAITLATRNFALPASVLLFFQPKAALPAAIGLIVHTVFFHWLMTKRVRA